MDKVLYVGVDAHQATSHITVMDETGRVLKRKWFAVRLAEHQSTIDVAISQQPTLIGLTFPPAQLLSEDRRDRDNDRFKKIDVRFERLETKLESRFEKIGLDLGALRLLLLDTLKPKASRRN